MTAPFDFVPLWTLIIGFGVFMYVLMDGFDLGVGILFRAAPSEAARDVMINSVAPIWDGNETWLVLGGVGLFAAFPLAYAIILPALYFPILVMLLALIFRGVSFELRFRAGPAGRRRWSAAFHYGSGLATLAQGARRVCARLSGRGPRLRRRRLRLGDPVLPLDGHRPSLRLCAARRHLADHQDGRHAAALGAAAGALADGGGAAGHGGGQPGNAISRSEHQDALVFLAEHPAAEPGADPDLGDCAAAVASHRSPRRVAAFLFAVALFAMGYLGLAISL